MILHRCFVGEAGAPRAPCVSFCTPPTPILSGVSAAGSIWAQWASVCRLRWDSEVNWELHLDLENHRALPLCVECLLSPSCRRAVSNA